MLSLIIKLKDYMKLEKINLGKGFIRFFLVIWLGTLVFTLSQTYQGVSYAIGITHWSPESVKARNELKPKEYRSQFD